METKVCVKCKTEKDISEFYIKKNGRLHSWCHECRKEAKREWDIKNKNHIIEYKLKNKEYIDIRNAEYRELHKEELRLKSILYNKKLKEKRKIYRQNPTYKSWRKEYEKAWREENREHTHAYIKAYYDADASRKIGRNLRHRLHKVLKGDISALHTNNISGCDLKFLKHHLESKFIGNMGWSNYGNGGWHIDHIIPCNAFDLTDPIQQKACFYWVNLQPLWGNDNISKNDNYFIEDFDKYMTWFRENIYK